VQQQLLQPNPIFLVGFLLCGLFANVAVWKVMAEVNARVPEDQRVTWWWWTIGKHLRLWREHKRLCPESHWRLYSVLSFSMAIILMIAALLSQYV
jgi:disulfide bond formation protein DsbB